MPGHPEYSSGDTEVHSITDAAAAHSDEMRQRMIKYAVAMGIRMVCLVLIFAVDGWYRLIPIIGAVFLPWVAVVIANGTDKAEIHSDALLDHAPQTELEGQMPAAGSPAGPPAGPDYSGPDYSGPDSARDEHNLTDPAMTLLQGELIDDDENDDNEDHRRAAS